MENNEILVNEELNNEIEAVEDQEYYDEDVSGGGLGKILAGVLFVGAAGLAAFAYKNKAKLESKRTEKQIARLESKGFMVVPADEVVVVKEVEEDDVDVEETE